MIMSRAFLPQNVRFLGRAFCSHGDKNKSGDSIGSTKDNDVIARPNKKKFKKPEVVDEINPLEKAAKDVADLIPEKDDKKKEEVQAELLSKLLGHINATGDKKASHLNISELISNMRVEADIKKEDEGAKRQNFRGEYVRRTIDGMKNTLLSRSNDKFRDKTSHPNADKFGRKTSNLFDSKRLSIFQIGDKDNTKSFCPTWDHLEKRELKMAITHPPVNYFEQMILWTEQGKVWKFPINNEQGMDDEVDVDFSEHIFLEQHLEGWCPTKGPVRHFMELVCVGLSKNPYITAQEKKDHIMWYKNYFEDKKELLKDLIVDMSNNKSKQLEC